MGENTSGGTFIELTASIVSAYVSNNSVPTADLPALIGQVHAALTRVSSGHVCCGKSFVRRRLRACWKTESVKTSAREDLFCIAEKTTTMRRIIFTQ